MVKGIKNQNVFFKKFFQIQKYLIYLFTYKRDVNKYALLVCIWFYFLEPVPVPSASKASFWIRDKNLFPG